MDDPYKTLQTILEKVRERSEAARYSKNPETVSRAILENQERLAEAMLIIGAVLTVIIDKQISVNVKAPPRNERN